MQVSFIIPLFNCLSLTRACVASLQATLPRGLTHEIILVDDGSTDGTREWLATLGPPFRVLLNDRNRGYAAANNRGAALATGELLVLLNNDLILTHSWLDPMLTAHRRLGPLGGLVGNVQLDARTGAVDHTGMTIDHKGRPRHERTLRPHLLRALFPEQRVVAVTGACVLVTRALWRELGGFDEAFHNGGEDVDLCLRARAAGRVTVVALRSMVRHHISASPGRKIHDEENSRRLACKWREELVCLAAREWCWEYLARQLTPAQSLAEHRLAGQALAYVLRMRRTPPEFALAGMRASLDLEFSRWDRILPPLQTG